MKRKLRSRKITNLKSLAGSPLAAWLKKRHYSLKSLSVSYLLPLPKKSLGKKVLALAAKQIGYKESPAGSNMTKYGLWYGANGESWCAIFISWVLSHCGRPFKYAYVPYVVNDAKAKKNGLSTIRYSQVASALKAGHVVLACYDWPGESKGLADHIGIVVKAIGPTTFEAIEGNTAVGNNSNGGEVMRRTRNTSDVLVFVLVSK